MSQLIVQTQQLTHRFSGGQPVLQDVNLEVPEGSIYGFLGPNGAGKTTTLRLILGLLATQQGSVSILGRDLKEQRVAVLRQVGSLIEQPSLYAHLTAKENLEVYRGVYGVDKIRVTEVLHLVGLAATGSKKAKQFSLGMKQRLSIALALLHQPKLLILDEPTNGLDPNGIIETRELVQRLNREAGVTIIVSSHILAEVEKMATHMGIIHGGRLLFQGTLPQLQALKQKQAFVQLQTSNNEAALGVLKGFAPERQNGHLLVPFTSQEDTAAINRLLVNQGIDVYQLNARTSDLEQLFLDLTSQSK
ncbi:ABC-2 type transport system ATP-binding protein [Cnuella takakiae]|uniref:ABC-2 type transport system ATP-binding protein n=1 Tax=Cnuella takakiae TaxID=1302690 RepID=A0A1M5AWI4_9BACT|nr:ABC transporter ATP-binding protein [Cnuella takakiae]OLY93246.1 multidrug ABC transporter ATP-binding protein [Cnuella takakiae]SHF34457.1 ABC-2 type transport system ATP-binding protein [Cnuella takakiae]